MSKSEKKVTIPPDPNYIPTIEGKKGFRFGGRTCQVLNFLRSGESSIDTKTLLERGKNAKASMSEEDAKFLRKYQNEIAPDCLKFTFVFPLWINEKKEVRALDKKSVDLLCVMKYPDTWVWDNNFRLVHFFDEPPPQKQLPAKTDP